MFHDHLRSRATTYFQEFVTKERRRPQKNLDVLYVSAVEQTLTASCCSSNEETLHVEGFVPSDRGRPHMENTEASYPAYRFLSATLNHVTNSKNSKKNTLRQAANHKARGAELRQAGDELRGLNFGTIVKFELLLREHRF